MPVRPDCSALTLALWRSYRPLLVDAGVGRAARPQRAVRAAVVDPGDELRPGRRPGCLPDSVAPLCAGLGCQRVLLALGGASGPGPAQVHQPPAAGLVALGLGALPRKREVPPPACG